MSSAKDNDSYQWVKFFEHWGITVTCLLVILATQAVFFLTRMDWANRLGFVIAGFVLQATGAALIGYAKSALYRKGEFFKWGSSSLPERFRRVYRLGWMLFLAGASATALLLVTS